MKTKRQRVVRPSKLDELIRATQQNYSSQSSATIVTKRNLLQYEHDQIEAKVVLMRAMIAKSLNRSAQLNAMILGLGLVLEKR